MERRRVKRKEGKMRENKKRRVEERKHFSPAVFLILTFFLYFERLWSALRLKKTTLVYTELGRVTFATQRVPTAVPVPE
jgi:hypothetical protein